MTGNEYQRLALRTWHAPDIPYGDMVIGSMGLNGEAGEVIDLVKKFMAQGHELDREHVAEELGDTLYYLAITALSIGKKLDDIMEANIEKLKRRYPSGFDSERSVNRSE